MQRLWDLLYDEDDEDMEQGARVSRVRQLIRLRLQQMIRLRINYFEELSENAFVDRFRLLKQSVTMLLNKIYHQLEHFTNWYIKL